MNEPDKTLKRSLTLPLITFYGLGNILGAGIYALIGKVRDAIPVYRMGGDTTVEGYLQAIEGGKECGIK